MEVSTFTARRKTVTTQAGDIAYTEFGDGPAALFIHGIGTSGAAWRHVIEQLAGTTRCIAVDLPVHGGTPARADLSVATMATLARDLADALDLGQVDLVGADTGGAVAQIFAARNPARLRTLALTNCDTDGNFPPPEFAPIIEAARQHQLAGALSAITADPAAWHVECAVDRERVMSSAHSTR
ncbi:MAG TPA: alpha/beta fold hydrolase [Trebonia sp.]|jgi:pimeloyl-ACP methyl ester carboxylesterase|nr:alpha/beta fold hydrolase [Trebonia sp.]